MDDFSPRLYCLKGDGASVNTGINKGLGAQLKESVPWLTFVHCFNDCFELAIKMQRSNYHHKVASFPERS